MDTMLYSLQEENNMTKHVILIQVTVEGPEAAFVTPATLANFIFGEVHEDRNSISTYGVTEVEAYEKPTDAPN